MRLLIPSILLTVGITSQAEEPQKNDSVYSESRDAASAYIGTGNFVVGKFAVECLSLLGRAESPQDFVQVWQQRNAKYLRASIKYMGKRLDEALASGGAERRDAVVKVYSAAVRGDGQAIVTKWLERGTKEDVCKRAISTIEAGAMDVSPKSPMYGELEALADWAQ